MDDAKLIEELQEKVREAEEILRRRKEALAALKGKSNASTRGGRSRGFRVGSIPAIAHLTLKGKPSLSLEDLTAAIKRVKPDIETRDVSVALSKYVRKGQHFVIDEAGKYSAK